MANATLASIDSALYAALSALVSGPPVEATPFAVCARYAGPVTTKGLSNVCREQYPAVLLRFDREPVTRDINTWGNTTEEVGDSSWSVVVVAEDPREIDDGVIGSTAAPGALRLMDTALAAVNSLLITDTYQGIPAAVTEVAPEMVIDGVVYAYAARLTVRRVMPQATNTDPAADLPYVQPMIGGIDLIDGQGDTDDVNPLVTFQADPNP